MVSTIRSQAASDPSIRQAIYNAASNSGVDFGYLFNQARVESGLNADAASPTSTATGLYQFIEQSWLRVVARHGAQHGLGWAASAIRQGRDGRYHADDPAIRTAILDLRRDSAAAAAMAAASASDNKAILETQLGHAVEPVDLYLAHFLGAGGASRFLRSFDANPAAPAASLFPAAARSNPHVFYARDGTARSLGDVRARFAAKFGGDIDPPTPWPGVQLTAVAARPSTATAQARFAYLMLASLGVSA